MTPGSLDHHSIDKLSLDELSARYPQYWAQVRDEIIPPLKSQNINQMQSLEASSRATFHAWALRLQKSQNNPKVYSSALKPMVESRMKLLVIQTFYDAALRRHMEGDKELTRKNRWLLNSLFFKEGLQRKPVSRLKFRWIWPFISQKGRFLSLVNEAGIYCFYSAELVSKLVQLIGDRSSLEVAAGDGTLTRFLNAAGAMTRASDDYSWSHRIQFPSFVEKMDAAVALKAHQPKVVLCSWPPADNSFERLIFETESVELYILITSRHRFAAGAWNAYEAQAAFEMIEDSVLSSLVLPPEGENAIYLFKRRG